ncbi:hypothetical protein Tco_0021928, partial [Tanacetum coccineum]
APTTLEELSQRVTDLIATLARDTHEIEARHVRQAWSQAMDCNRVVHAELLAYQAEVKALREQISVLQRQRTKLRFTRHIQQGYDRTREPELAKATRYQDGPADAGSSCRDASTLRIQGGSFYKAFEENGFFSELNRG